MNGRTLAVALIASLASLACLAFSQPPEPSWDQLEKSFRELPVEARRYTGPLFWLHGDESKERLEMYVQKVAEGGNGTFTAESRPHNDWLGPNWYRDLDICLQAARKHNLTMWIFDEKWWPSQELGGKVPIEYGSKVLDVRILQVVGPRRIDEEVFSPNPVGIVAGREVGGGVDPSSLVDLAMQVHKSGDRGRGELTWDVPPGTWKIHFFTWSHAKGKRNVLVDGASQDCVDWFLQTVYQPHYDRFKSDFGKTIVGYFYDEPETHGDWGTEVMKVLAERGIDWKKALVAYKSQLAGDEQAAARYQYLDAFAEAWGRTMYGGMTKWCRDHNVLSIGHFLEHNWEYQRRDLCAGNMFQLQKYSDMGAIDAVFRQFVPGKKNLELWQTPKLGSSISHVYGKTDDLAMVEIFGARGQDLTYPEMKWWTDHMHASGINFHIPHSFNPRAPYDTDCPPYFYNGGYEPRFPLYRVYADYTSRLTLLLTGGRHVCPVAMLYGGQGYHVGKGLKPEALAAALQAALFDHDWLPYDAFDAAAIEGGLLRLHKESYRILIVPPVEVMPVESLARAKAFFDAGGIVVGWGMLPAKSASLGKPSGEIASLVSAIWGSAQPSLKQCKASAAGGKSFFLPEKITPDELFTVLAEGAGVRPTLEVVEGKTDHWVHVLHRVKSGRDVFFIANQNHQGEARKLKFRIRAAGEPECFDAMRNEITAVPFKRIDDRTIDVDLVLCPQESVALVFAPARRVLPPRQENSPPARRTIAIARDPAGPPKESVPPVLPTASKGVHDGASWIWYPEGSPATSAPVGTRYFRTSLVIPPGRAIKSAVLYLSVDNEAEVFANGQRAGSASGWHQISEIDLAKLLVAGPNVLALAAVNASDKPNPAGVIGKLIVKFESGEPQTMRIDQSWKASREAKDGWEKAGFDDRAWPNAKVVAQYGDKPWGKIGFSRGPTLSPVKDDTFAGRFDIPADLDISRWRIYFECDAISPEAAANIAVNGKYAGGFIEKPFRLDFTGCVKPGANAITIAPFAPAGARLSVYEK